MDAKKARAFRNWSLLLAGVFLLGLPFFGSGLYGCKSGRGITAYGIDGMLLVLAIGSFMFFYGQEIRTRTEHRYYFMVFRGKYIQYFAYGWMAGGIAIAFMSIFILMSMFVPMC